MPLEGALDFGVTNNDFLLLFFVFHEILSKVKAETKILSSKSQSLGVVK